jgi:hypothetical protein
MKQFCVAVRPYLVPQVMFCSVDVQWVVKVQQVLHHRVKRGQGWRWAARPHTCSVIKDTLSTVQLNVLIVQLFINISRETFIVQLWRT